MLTSDLVKQVIAEQLGVKLEEVADHSLLVDDLGADSLDTIELCMELEDKLRTEISDSEISNDFSVLDVINLAKTKVGPQCDATQ